MRILAAVAYVLLGFVGLWIARRNMPAKVDRIASGGRPATSNFSAILSVGVVFIIYLQYFVLTGAFPVNLVVVLLLSLLILRTASYILGAVLGLDTSENLRKTAFLSFLWGAFAGRSYSVLIAGIGIVYLAWPAVVLWQYFSGNADAADSVVIIAVLHFCIPAIMAQFLFCLCSWYVSTSHHVDDDVRNSNLMNLLSMSMITTIIVLYPSYEVATGTAAGITSQYNWLLLATPAFIALFGGLLPFLAGTFRYRAELAGQVRWRREWIAGMLNVLNAAPLIPAENARDRLEANLDQEIRNRIGENKLLRLLMGGDMTNRQQHVPAIAPAGSTVRSVPASEGLPAAGERSDDGKAAVAASLRDHILHARGIIAGSAVLDLASGVDWVERGTAFINRERANLIRWDPAFQYIDDLLTLRLATVDYPPKTLKAYLKNRALTLDAEAKSTTPSKKKSRVASIVLGLLTWSAASTAAWVFKAYGTHIVDFIGLLVRLPPGLIIR